MEKWRKITLHCILLVCIIAFVIPITTYAIEPNALVILNTTDVSSMKKSIDFIEENGGRIAHVYPPHILIGYAPESASQSLINEMNISGIYHYLVDTSLVEHYGETEIYVIESWNNKFSLASQSSAMSLSETPPPPLMSDALEAPKFLVQETSEVQSLSSPAPSNPSGAPYGATSGDTSCYMMGDIAVGVVLVESDGSIDPSSEDWTSSEKSDVISEIQAGLNWWINQNSNAKLTFTYDIHYDVPTSYEPITRSGPSGESLWIAEAMTYLGYTKSYFTAVRDYDNYLRDTLGTDWAYTIFVVDSSNDADGYFTDSWFAWAYLGGPFIVENYKNDGWGIANMDKVTAHETGHIFWARDEYDGSTGYSGYLNASETESSGCIMDNNNWCISSGTLLQIGWRDTDGDNILDILDTYPDSTLNTFAPDPSSNNTPTYTGSAIVTPYPNSHPSCCGGRNITINTISNIQHRVDGGSWTDATPSDSVFNDSTESFLFTTSALSDGSHTIEVRANNSVGNLETSYSSDTIFIDANPPRVSFLSPIPNENVTGSIYVNVSASDGNGMGVDHVFLQNGTGGSWVQMDIYEGDSSDGNYSLFWDSINFEDGLQVLTVNATDNMGHFNDSISINIMVDNSPPSVSEIFPVNSANISKTQYINVSITDAGTGVSAAIANVSNSTWSGEFMLSYSGTGDVWYNDSWDTTLQSDGAYSIVVNATDFLEHSNASGGVMVTVDNTNPNVGINSPTDGENLSGVLIINATVTDSGSKVSSVLVKISNSSYFVDITLVKGEGYWYNDSWDSRIIGDGDYNITINATDYASNFNDTEFITVTVDNVPPSVVIIAPSDGENVSGVTQINASFFDEFSGIETARFRWENQTSVGQWWDLNGTLDTAQLADGFYNITYFVNDTVGNYNSTEFVSITIDNNVPSVAIIIPKDGQGVNGTRTINVTVADAGTGVSSVIANISNTSYSSIYLLSYSDSSVWHNDSWDTSSLNEGSYYNVSINATDFMGYSNITEYVTVMSDKTPPTSTVTNPVEGQNISSTSYDIIGSAYDANSGVLRIWVSTDGGTSWNLADGTTSWSYMWTTSDGAHEIQSKAEDKTYLNESEIETVTVNVDATAPVLTFLSPTPSSGASLSSGTTSVTMNISVSEAHPDTLIFNWDGSNTSYNYSNGYWTTGQSISSGNSYTFYAWANDTFGNAIQTSSVTFSVESAGGNGGGGGGGGSSPSDKETKGKIVTPTKVNVKAQIKAKFYSIPEGKTGTIEIPELEEMPLTEMKIKVNKKVTNIKVDMKVLTDKPAEVIQDAAAMVFKYLEINYENIKNEDVDTVTIKFKVEKSWLTKEGISPSKVVLKRYADSRWESLTTYKLGEDDENIYFSADSPGLSHFAVAVEEEAKKFDSALAELMGTSPEQTKPPETTPAPTISPPETVTTKEEKKGICGPSVILVIALLTQFTHYLLKRRDSLV